ncbi:MAG: ABC transporter permease [Actinobacteria bacterium]|nr:ABC transporter permease [Actinomycetota bacterium]
MRTAAILAGIVGREFKRVLRSRSRLASTFARPLIWLIIIGSGFSALIPGGNFSYHKYLLPGIVGMVVLFSSLLSALGSVQDREFGSMRMLMIAPVPRGLIVLGKVLAATLMGLFFAIVLTPLAWVFEVDFGLADWLRFLAAVLLCGLALSSLGMLVAARIRRLENFAVAMNFVIFPMFFLSGALYPTEKLAAWLQPLVRLNPLTYGVDLMRHALLAQEFPAVSHVEFQPRFDVAFLLASAVVCLALAAKLFGREEHLAPMLLGAAPRRRPVARQVGVGRFRLPAPSGPLSGIVGREFKRAVRQRGRLASTFARPLLWLIAAGTGFSALIPGGDYQTYLLPGIIGMVILFSCLLSALGSVHDRQFGPMRMLLIAPVPRGLVVFGKTLAAALLGTAFAVVFSLLAPIYGIAVSAADYLEFVGAAFLCALALSSLGMLAAARIRKLEDFAVAMNFVVFPLFFFSGALYPAAELPGWMQPFVRLNPLTYGVDLMRQTLLAGERHVLAPAEFHARFDVAVLAAFAIVCLALAAKLFGREEHLAPMMLGGAARRLPRSIASRRWRSSSTVTTTR